MTIYQERQLIKNLTGCRHICDIGDGLWENNNFMLFVVTCGNYEVVFAGCVAIVQRRCFRSFSIRQLGADIIKQPMYNKTRVASLLLLVVKCCIWTTLRRSPLSLQKKCSRKGIQTQEIMSNALPYNLGPPAPPIGYGVFPLASSPL